MFFSSKKREYEKSRVPPDWPSYLHSKCSKYSSCKHANPPQAASGTFVCCGTSKSGKPCKGTYIVTPSAASEFMNIHRNQMWLEGQAKHHADVALAEQLARQKGELNAAEVQKYTKGGFKSKKGLESSKAVRFEDEGVVVGETPIPSPAPPSQSLAKNSKLGKKKNKDLPPTPDDDIDMTKARLDRRHAQRKVKVSNPKKEGPSKIEFPDNPYLTGPDPSWWKHLPPAAARRDLPIYYPYPDANWNRQPD